MDNYDDYDDDDNYDDHDYQNFKNSIIYLDEPLRFIVNNMKINVVQGNIEINLLDYFPLLKNGLTTIRTVRQIFFIYEKLGNINPFEHQLYIDAFNGKVPINYFDFYQKLENISTSETKGIYEEHYLMEELSNKTIFYSSEINLVDFVSSINNIGDSEWYNLLIESKFNLYVAIILGNKDSIEFVLEEIDPRNDNNEAYHLAVRLGNRNNIELIKNKIIELNWLDKQAIIQQFDKYNLLSDDIITYYQSTKYGF